MADGKRFDQAVVDDILSRIHPIRGRAFVVALDGPGGSGKSTLALQLAAAYGQGSVVVRRPHCSLL